MEAIRRTVRLYLGNGRFLIHIDHAESVLQRDDAKSHVLHCFLQKKEGLEPHEKVPLSEIESKICKNALDLSQKKLVPWRTRGIDKVAMYYENDLKLIFRDAY